MTAFPTIQWDDKTLYEMGCRRCKRGGTWRFYVDAKKEIYVAECLCGHRVEIIDKNIVRKPDEYV